ETNWLARRSGCVACEHDIVTGAGKNPEKLVTCCEARALLGSLSPTASNCQSSHPTFFCISNEAL
ncbi:unnamed protein product, partial [Mycena citricolor]